MTIGRTRLGYQSKGYLHTTDATADQSLLVCEIPFKHSATVAVYITAIADTGDYLFERSVHSVSRDGAAATYIGELSNDALSLGAGAWVTTIDCTGTTLRVRVTGEAAHVIEWTAVAVFETSAVNVPIVWECATTDTTQSWTVRATNLVKYWFDWGDGNFDEVTGSGADQVTAHNYAAAGQYAIRVMIEDKADLLRFLVNGNALAGVLPDMSLWTGATQLRFQTGLLTGTVPSLAAMTALTHFYCGDNRYLTGTLPSLTALVALATVSATTNQLSGYTASTIAATCVNFLVGNNLLPESAIDQILADFETGVAGRPAAGTITLGGTGNAPPSADGLASKAAILAAKPGWAITHN